MVREPPLLLLLMQGATFEPALRRPPLCLQVLGAGLGDAG